jgi:hypothetical protein
LSSLHCRHDKDDHAAEIDDIMIIIIIIVHHHPSSYIIVHHHHHHRHHNQQQQQQQHALHWRLLLGRTWCCDTRTPSSDIKLVCMMMVLKAFFSMAYMTTNITREVMHVRNNMRCRTTRLLSCCDRRIFIAYADTPTKMDQLHHILLHLILLFFCV